MFKQDIMLHNRLKKQPEDGTPLKDYDVGGHFHTLYLEKSRPYMYYETNTALIKQVQEELSNLKKDFIHLRAGQTWYVGYFILDRNKQPVIRIESRYITGRTKLGYNKETKHLMATMTFRSKAGRAGIASGGYKTSSLDKHARHHLSNAEPLIESFGGLKRKRVLRQMETYLKCYRDEITACLEYDRRENEELWEDYGECIL